MKLDEYDLTKPPKIRDDGFFGGPFEPVKLIYDFKSKGVKNTFCQLISYGNVLRQISDRHPKKYRRQKGMIQTGLG